MTPLDGPAFHATGRDTVDPAGIVELASGRGRAY
jgi:hypothetical protein